MENFGQFTYRPMDAKSAREIALWQYPAPYTLYNSDLNTVDETVQWYLQPENRYFAVFNAAGELIGFRCFGNDAQVPGGDYSADALDMGGGLKPALTGQGLGAVFMESAFAFARRHYAPRAFRATVAAFNQRALRVCEKVGYRRVAEFTAVHTERPFIILLRAANQEKPRGLS